MHDEIQNYYLSGTIDDANIVTDKVRLVEFLEGVMRDDGAVPALDLEPQFTLSYRPDAQVYDFELTVYGISIGKDRAWQESGIMAGKMISKSTRPTK